MARRVIPINEYPDELPSDSEPHGADPGWFRHDVDMDEETVRILTDFPAPYSEREIERSQANITVLFGPERIGWLNEGFFPEYDDTECGGPVRCERPVRQPAGRIARWPLTYIIAGVLLGAGLVILIALALLPQSLGGKQPAAAPLPQSPAALIQERLT